MLFLYLEEMRELMKTLYKKTKKEKKRKVRKANMEKIAHVAVLVSYLDEDYEETKKTLYPLLESGLITFDLLWALYKPNTIAYTTTYGNSEEPRAFKVEYASRDSSFMRGVWYCIEGRYLEYDGKSFGMGRLEVDVDSFNGTRKITSLATYPLKYHKQEAALRQQLTERGKKFISLQGMNYRFHQGLGFYKKRRSVVKVNVNSRIMVDAATHRRINPNYPISSVRRTDQEDEECEADSENESCCSCGACAEDVDGQGSFTPDLDEDQENNEHDEGEDEANEAEDGDGDLESGAQERIEKLPNQDKPERPFTDEELLIASPVVLGFAFSEKLWLEF